MRCFERFELNGNDNIECSLVQGSNDTVVWSQPGKCESKCLLEDDFQIIFNFVEKPLCTNTTCKNNGVCSPMPDGDFSCNCTRFFAGKSCDLRLILTSELSELILESITVFTVSTDTDTNFSIFISSVRSKSCANAQGLPIYTSCNPIRFSNQENSADLHLFPTRVGLYYLTFFLTSGNIEKVVVPDPIPVIVRRERSLSMTKLYFEMHEKLEPGCCEIPTRLLMCGGLPDNDPVLVSSSCWFNERTASATSGLVFSTLNNVSIPISVSGLNIKKSNLLTSTLQETNEEHKTKCSSRDECSCDAVVPSSEDLIDFVSRQALSTAFIDETRTMFLPNWIQLNVTKDIEDPLKKLSESDYKVKIASEATLSSLTGCTSVIVDTIGHFAVLQHDGPLNMKLQVSVNELDDIDLQPPPKGSFYCFAVNLCLEEASPVYIGIPMAAQEFLQRTQFVKEYTQREWTMTFHSTIIRKIPRNSLFNIRYWDGLNLNNVSRTIKSNIVLYMDLSGMFVQESKRVAFEFSGNASHYYETEDSQQVSNKLIS